MTADQSGELRAAIEEALLLAEDDPKRREVLRRVEGAGDPARRLWLELMRENERLRLELRDVAMPQELRERLLEIPGRSVRRLGRRRFGWWAAALLALPVLVAAAAVLWPALRGPGVALEAVRDLAALAVQDHARRPDLEVLTKDRAAMVTMLGAEAPFGVYIPRLIDEHYRLEGGRICRFGDKPLVYTRWVCRGREHSLYQVQPEDFGLPEHLEAQSVSVPAIGHDPPLMRVRVWAEGSCAYAFLPLEAAGPD
jgi:hypothetical protein